MHHCFLSFVKFSFVFRIFLYYYNFYNGITLSLYAASCIIHSAATVATCFLPVSIPYYSISFVMYIIIRRFVSTVDRKNEDRHHIERKTKYLPASLEKRRKTVKCNNEQITKSPNSRKYKQEMTSFSLIFSYFRIYHEENYI